MTWLFAGHLAGGLVLGSLMAVAAFGVGSVVGGTPHDTGRLVVVALVAIAATAFDLGGARIPGRRQVDETWLTSFRGWVYGIAFGAQLGFGLVTVVNTAMLAVVLAAGVLAGPGAALAIGIAHGFTRAVIAAANGRVRTVNDLKRLHRRLDKAAAAVRIGAPALLLALVGSVTAATLA